MTRVTLGDVAFGLALAFAAFVITATLWLALATLEERRSITFDERWSPVQSIDGGMKGDRLDKIERPPVRVPQQRQPTMHPMKVRVAGGCVSFCEFP